MVLCTSFASSNVYLLTDLFQIIFIDVFRYYVCCRDISPNLTTERSHCGPYPEREDEIICSPIHWISSQPLRTCVTLQCLGRRPPSSWPNIVVIASNCRWFSAIACHNIRHRLSCPFEVIYVDYTAWVSKNDRHDYVGWMISFDRLRLRFTRIEALFRKLLSLLCVLVIICFLHSYETERNLVQIMVEQRQSFLWSCVWSELWANEIPIPQIAFTNPSDN